VSSVELSLHTTDLVKAMDALNGEQVIFRHTRAVHGAGFYIPASALIAAREDVGRHNALDKLAGCVLRSGHSGSTGVVVVTSRISVEMVQKAAILGSPILAAVSAPTALAIETAEKAGMTLVALVRGEDLEIFTHAERIVLNMPDDKS
jgi:FdhD protein